LDVFTGAGEVVTAAPDNEHADLFATFPNSYGSLGYATRLRIELEPIGRYVALRHVRFDDAAQTAKAIAEIVETGAWADQPVHGLDGVAFAPDELYLTLARWVASPDEAADLAPDLPSRPSDYTGQRIFYRSLQDRETDLLTAYDYLWRWDTDWFWCSKAFGAQHPVARRLWPRRWRRSDVYYRLVTLDQRLGLMNRLDQRAGRPQRERVIQDVEVPVDRLPEFLAWFDDQVGMRPVWLCPLRLREAAGAAPRRWPTYPLTPGTTYVNVGFWGTVHVGPEAPEGPRNRAIEAEVTRLGGHKSLYSEAFYDRETFDELYAGDNLAAVKQRYDPQRRLTDLYDKVVRRR
jgi:FAD/FMN-containing dehydrogenase